MGERGVASPGVMTVAATTAVALLAASALLWSPAEPTPAASGVGPVGTATALGHAGAVGSEEAAGPAAGPAAARFAFQEAQELPEGVTPEMVDRGREIFRRGGFCYTCHGEDATGLPHIGTDLTDGEWIHSEGTYEELVETIRSGVRADRSTTGVPMPPRGGARLTDEQVRAVAAYVWTLSAR